MMPLTKLEGNGPKDERAAIIVLWEANFDLGFEISNLNYPGLYVYIAVLEAAEAMVASKWPRGHIWPQIEPSDLNYPGMYVYIAILEAAEDMVASKWPRGHIWPQIWTQWPQLPMFPCFSGL